MITGFLITIREGLEAFLIIGILLGYLTKINQPRLKVHVWIGAGAAFLVSILLAAVFQALAITFEGEAAELFEAAGSAANSSLVRLTASQTEGASHEMRRLVIYHPILDTL